MNDRKVVFEAKNLKKYFPASGGRVVRAVDGVSFVIHEGETFGLVGESGCGKTTCGRMLMGVYPPTEGEVLYHGRNLNTLDRHERMDFCKDVQMIFQDPYACLDPRMSIGSIIAEGTPNELKNRYSYDSLLSCRPLMQGGTENLRLFCSMSISPFCWTAAGRGIRRKSF